MKALFDFEKVDDEELDFQVDDILLVEVAERRQAGEWMQAQHERTYLKGNFMIQRNLTSGYPPIKKHFCI